MNGLRPTPVTLWLRARRQSLVSLLRPSIANGQTGKLDSSESARLDSVDHALLSGLGVNCFESVSSRRSRSQA
jgi:hypothetical protein